MREILTKLINTITQARVTRVSADTERYPSAQISSGRKVSLTTRLLPYPLVGNPSSDALGVKLNLQGQEQNSATIFHDPKHRLRGLAEGEGGIHNALTDSYILLMANGDIKMVSVNDLVATVTANVISTIGGNVTNTITGNLTDTVTGDISSSSAIASHASSGSYTITAPTINLVGAVTINGTLAMTGTGTATMKNITATGTLTSNGKNISDSHTHDGTTGGVT